jgi:hypothetical protein
VTEQGHWDCHRTQSAIDRRDRCRRTCRDVVECSSCDVRLDGDVECEWIEPGDTDGEGEQSEPA